MATLQKKGQHIIWSNETISVVIVQPNFQREYSGNAPSDNPIYHDFQSVGTGELIVWHP